MVLAPLVFSLQSILLETIGVGSLLFNHSLFQIPMTLISTEWMIFLSLAGGF
jgi:hypothetical protein